MYFVGLGRKKKLKIPNAQNQFLKSQFVLACIASSSPGLDVDLNDDIFVLGIDSLKAVTIAAMLNVGLRRYNPKAELVWLSDQTLYAHPTAAQLSEKVYSFLNRDTSSMGQSKDGSDTRTIRMAAVVAKFGQILPQRPAYSPSPSDSSGTCVALTGSTGALGPHLLDAFLNDPTVSRIYCLKRSPDAGQRHHTMLTERGMPPPDDSMVTYLTIDFSKDHLGLPAALFAELLNTVNVIVHNAWKVDFKHSLRSYEAIQIRSIRQLIDFSISSPHSPRILFVSSASAVGNWILMYKDRAVEPPSIPETFIPDYDAAQQMGYGESKHVAERILQVAHARSGVPVNILRIGQTAGLTRSSDMPWPEQE